MTIEVATIPAFTVVRTINKVPRVLTETNVHFSGKKAERTQAGERTILNQWNAGDFVPLMATFAGALGPMVEEKMTEAAVLLNSVNAGDFDAARPNRVLVAITLGNIIKALEAKANKTKSKAMRGETLRFHGIAVDLTAKYAALVAERKAKADAAALAK